MNALLEKMIDAEKNSEIETCILWVLDDAGWIWNENAPAYKHASKAAAELEAMRQALEQAKQALERVMPQAKGVLVQQDIVMAINAIKGLK